MPAFTAQRKRRVNRAPNPIRGLSVLRRLAQHGVIARGSELLGKAIEPQQSVRFASITMAHRVGPFATGSNIDAGSVPVDAQVAIEVTLAPWKQPGISSQ